MKLQRKRRLYFILFLLIGLSVAVGFSLFALRENINLYYTPKDIAQHKEKVGQVFRLGGLVVKGSVRRIPNTLKVSFVLTDFHNKIMVAYDGMLPSLFREGQGIVAQGCLNKNGLFVADQVLAKHDANYHPPLSRHARPTGTRNYYLDTAVKPRYDEGKRRKPRYDEGKGNRVDGIYN